MAYRETFFEVLTKAMNAVSSGEAQSEETLAQWQSRLREAAQREVFGAQDLEARVREEMQRIYSALIEKGGVLSRHKGVARFGPEKVRPQLRTEMERRIKSATDLIRLNRAEAVDTSLRRFIGWSSSIPPGGGGPSDRREEKERIRKGLSGLPFEERRVLIDQGQKFRQNLSEILAMGNGAIACVWHSHWRQSNYNFREDHKERDENVYLLKESWAKERGLVKTGEAGYYDDITKAGQEVYCRCYVTWIYRLSDLPDEMLTARGREELEKLREAKKRMFSR